MKVWKKLTKWESHIEKAPKIAIIKILSLFFSSSLAVGMIISFGARFYQTKLQEKFIQDTRNAEYSRMNARLEMLSKSGHGFSQK